MLTDALLRAGYNQEEEYFYRENRKLILNFKAAQEKRRKQLDTSQKKDAAQKRPDSNRAA